MRTFLHAALGLLILCSASFGGIENKESRPGKLRLSYSLTRRKRQKLQLRAILRKFYRRLRQIFPLHAG